MTSATNGKQTVAIIGSGIGGIGTAIRLAAKGYQVTVFESNTYPGGKLTQLRNKGYRFDAGPSLFTMPEYVEELFALSGRNISDYFAYFKEQESGRYFWNDGTRLVAHADTSVFADEVENILGAKAPRTLSRLRRSETMYNLAGHIFLHKPLNRWSTWINTDVARALLHIHKLGVFSTMHAENRRLLQNAKLIQLFDRYATYNGSSPYKAPAALNVIPHLEHSLGTYLPEKGMHQITESLYTLAQELGVCFRFGERVERILHNGKAVSGVVTSQGSFEAGIVVSDMDVLLTYRRLLSDIKAPEFILGQERSTSALIFYWGIRHSFAELGLHNVFFGDDYRGEFDRLFKGIVPDTDPTVYVSVTAKRIPEDAPQGCENWFVMLNVPPHRQSFDWQKLIPQYRKIVLDKLSRVLGCPIAPLVEVEETLSPLDIEIRTSSFGGSLYGNSSNNRFSAFLRHTNNSSRLKNLYFCGGSVHPGGGIPLCLLSAKIVSELIAET
ncbi:MAG TPA: phytoene desaturase family protein [Bacteroidales bacterium]|nr:phytoene desaturase family protein [Bacteroidales bacterium]